MHRIPGHTSSMAWVSSASDALSLRSSVSNEMPSRTDMIAMPWSPIMPDTSTRSPGRAFRRTRAFALGGSRPMPVVVM